MKALFIGADLGGNVPPAVSIAAELAARGHDVVLAGYRLRDGEQAPPGLVLTGLPAAAHDFTRAAGPLAMTGSLARLSLGRAMRREAAAAIAAERPDAVVVDCVLQSALRAALASGAPTAVLFHSILFSTAFATGAARLAGAGALRLWARADARIMPSDETLARTAAAADPVEFDWVGPTEPAVAATPTAPTTVLVSLSTTGVPGQTEVYQRIVDALAGIDARVIVTTGGAEVGELTPAANAVVHGRHPHAAILPDASLVIGHGGHSTTVRALAHGVPVLVLPMNPMSDQPMIGRLVEDAGLGRTLRRTATVETIRDAATAILADPGMAARAARAGERLRARDGAALGADVVERLADARRTSA